MKYMLVNMNSHPVEVDIRPGFPGIKLMPGVANAYHLGELDGTRVQELRALRRIKVVLRPDIASVQREAPVQPQTTEEPAGQTTEEPAGQTTEEPAGQTTEEPAGQTTEEPAGQTNLVALRDELLAGRDIRSIEGAELKEIFYKLGLTHEGDTLSKKAAIAAIEAIGKEA